MQLSFGNVYHACRQDMLFRWRTDVRSRTEQCQVAAQPLHLERRADIRRRNTRNEEMRTVPYTGFHVRRPCRKSRRAGQLQVHCPEEGNYREAHFHVQCRTWLRIPARSAIQGPDTKHLCTGKSRYGHCRRREHEPHTDPGRADGRHAREYAIDRCRVDTSGGQLGGLRQ